MNAGVQDKTNFNRAELLGADPFPFQLPFILHSGYAFKVFTAERESKLGRMY